MAPRSPATAAPRSAIWPRPTTSATWVPSDGLISRREPWSGGADARRHRATAASDCRQRLPPATAASDCRQRLPPATAADPLRLRSLRLRPVGRRAGGDVRLVAAAGWRPWPPWGNGPVSSEPAPPSSPERCGYSARVAAYLDLGEMAGHHLQSGLPRPRQTPGGGQRS